MPRASIALSLAIAGLTVSAATADIIQPTFVSDTNAFNSASTTVNNAGMVTAVNDGDSLASALLAAHELDGTFDDSYVSNASGDDYFEAPSPGAPPVIVYDLGADTAFGSIILWNYENNGGGRGSSGNHLFEAEVRINLDADGSATFAGAATTLSNIINGHDNGNGAQFYSLGAVTGRYVQLTLTDNYRGVAGVNFGGDRVGLGEVRFATETVVPEPASAALVGLGTLLIARRRRAA